MIFQNSTNKKTMKEKNNQIIIYNTEDGETKIKVKMEDETVWLSQKQMAELLACSTDNIGLHLKNIFKEAELSENSVTEEYSVVQKEDNREVARDIDCYNLDVIMKINRPSLPQYCGKTATRQG